MLRLDALHVRARSPSDHKARVHAAGAAFVCAIGRGGIRGDKREGDGATPAGAFRLRMLYYRADRLARPACGLPALPIARSMGWSDDPGDPLYNRPVTLPRRFGHESMWRDDPLYDLVIVIGHNDAPVISGAGSAVFMHLARDGYLPTEGCVALSRPDMLRLLPRLSTGTLLHIWR